ncbi:MAG: hypothetical protein Q3M24_13020 [Candidatus Electrothrix aestuarii]|uniref:Uncharacterized protein n=1 Tax=Candidatus Electrothrix aestuarii TaxID=3062594 RepID=A0AAU8LQP0_9BACT|nr:hypothetical protein [Candidatus Electrothrix aestuarii]
MEMTVKCKFEYEVSGKIESGETVSRSGETELVRSMDIEDDVEPEMLYSEAVQAALQDFWYFELSKNGQSYTFPDDLTVSIRNLTDLTDYGDE